MAKISQFTAFSLASAAFILFSAKVALASAHCDAEFETLKSFASNIDVQFQSDDVVTAGDPIQVKWSRARDRLPDGVSAWLVIVSIDNVRFSGRGFYPLPGGTPGPLGIDFASKWMRAIVPLHTPDAQSRGKFGIKPYREGKFGLSWTVIAKSSCGEKQLRDVGTYRVIAEARKPRIVVQDLYDYSRPSAVIHSLNDRHELRVFDGYFQVFDRRSGAKLIDRRGYCPDFSPTGRFVAALAGRSDGACEFYTAGENKPKFEIIDVVTGDIVASPNPPALWAHGDAFMMVESKWWKMLQPPGPAISLLVDDEAGRALKLLDIPEAEVAGVDVANGYIYRLDSEGQPLAAHGLGGQGEITEHQVGWNQAKGEAIVSGIPLESLLGFLANNSGSATNVLPPLKNGQVAASHLRYIDSPGDVFDALGDGETSAMTRRSPTHPSVDTGDDIVASNDPVLTASLLRGATLLGSARTTARTIESIVNEQLDSSFTPQQDVSNPAALVIDKMWEIDKLDISDVDKRAQLQQFEKRNLHPAIDRLIADMPQAEDVMKQSLGCWPSGGVRYRNELAGIWRHQTSKRLIWLAQAGCQGIGTVGNLALNQIDLFVREAGQTAHYNLLFDRQFYCAGNNVDCDYVSESSDEEELTKREQGYGQLRPSGDLPEDPLGAKIPQSFQQLIEFESLTPAFLNDRFLLLPIGRKMFVVDLENRSMSGPLDLDGHASKSRFSLSDDLRHFMQVNEDGSIAIHDIASGDVVLRGRYVDDEIVIWDRHGHYLSTYEGAQYVHMRFVGRPELYSLERMAGSLNQPKVVRAALDDTQPVRQPELPAPPRLSAELSEETETGQPTISVEARSQTGLTRLRLFADGVLFGQKDIDGTEWTEELELEIPAKTDWLSLVAIDRNGFESAPVEIRLPSSPQKGSRLFVVAVGTDKYEDADSLSELDFAVSDARNFTEAVRKMGSTRYGELEVVGPFLDSETLKADLDLALAEIRNRSGPGDTVMFFVAGHGIRADDGQFYMATRSTQLDDLAATGLSWQYLAETLAGLDTRTFIFLDACHSGSVGDATNDGATDALLDAADGSITVIAASKGRQFSLESPSVGGGYFTGAITSILGKRSDPQVDRDGSGTLDLDELYLALKRQVVIETAGRQTPWIARAQVVGKTPLF